jgi:ABC-2 type transport system permease protein
MNMPPPSVPQSVEIGIVNWLGVWTLYQKEVRRFLNVFTQTIVAPMVTTLLFYAVLALALGRAVTHVGAVGFSEFLVPGLIMMAIVQNAFANTSSSILISKVQGNIVDILMPPLSPGEMTFAFTMGGVTRGLVVGVAVSLAMLFFVPYTIHFPFYVLFHALTASTMMSLLGIIGGIWSERFDHMAAVTNFVITPLTFLSGTFYSIDRLPGIWNTMARFNPFFYMIDGFRYGFIGQSDSDPALGITVMIIMDLLWAWVTLRMFATGYKLKT